MIDRLQYARHTRALLLELCETAPTKEEHRRLMENTVRVSQAISDMTDQRAEEYQRAVVQG